MAVEEGSTVRNEDIHEAFHQKLRQMIWDQGEDHLYLVSVLFDKQVLNWVEAGNLLGIPKEEVKEVVAEVLHRKNPRVSDESEAAIDA